MKLNVFAFCLPVLRLIHDYLSHRKHRTRVNNSYREWLVVMFGLPQGSILGPLFFSLFLANFFFMHKDIDITHFADGNTPYLSAKIAKDVVESLE